MTQQGKCQRCANPSEGMYLCKNCREQRKQQLINKITKGVCIRCDNPLASGKDSKGRNHIYCPNHLESKMKRIRYGRSKAKGAKIGYEIEE